MNKIIKISFFFFSFIIFSLGTRADGKLLFKTGFEKSTGLKISGSSHMFTGKDYSTGFSWDSNDVPGAMRFVYLAGDRFENYVTTRLDTVRGYDGKPTTALYMTVRNDFPGDKFGAVTRNEFSFFPDKNSPFDEGYVTLKIKLQENLPDIAPKTRKSRQLDYYNLDSWRMLMEIKEPNSGVSFQGRGTNNYRISFFIARDSLSNDMYWILRGEMPQPVRKIDWQIENRNVRVPVGEWLEMEVYFKKDKEAGRVWWAVNGQEVADYKGRTEHPDNPLPVRFWSFVKLYQDESWFEKGDVYQWVDDLEFWSSWPTGKKKIADGDGETVLTETFGYPDGPLPPHWWSEGNVAQISDGHLFVDADTKDYRSSTIWLDREISGKIKVEFDVRVISSGDTANNINCFLLYSDPGGEPLRSTKQRRANGAYSHYHALNGYIFTYLANGHPESGRIRLRDNPEFHLLAEAHGAECFAGKTYHIRIEKEDNRLRYWVNGEKRIDKTDDEYNEPPERGLFGFRTWHTSLWFDNLTISRLD